MKISESAQYCRTAKCSAARIWLSLVLVIMPVPLNGQSDPMAGVRKEIARQQQHQQDLRRQQEIEAQRQALAELRERQQREINNQRQELEKQRRELDKQQNQIDQINQEGRDAALVVQRQQRLSEIERSIASLELIARLGNPLSDEQVTWIRAAGAHGKAYPDSEFRGYVQRLYNLYFAEKSRRGK